MWSNNVLAFKREVILIVVLGLPLSLAALNICYGYNDIPIYSTLRENAIMKQMCFHCPLGLS